MQQRHQLQRQTVARLQCCQSRSLAGAQGAGSASSDSWRVGTGLQAGCAPTHSAVRAAKLHSSVVLARTGIATSGSQSCKLGGSATQSAQPFVL